MHCNTTSTIFIPSSVWNHLHSSVPICLINGVWISAMRKHSLMDRTWSHVGMKGSSVFSRPPSRERYYSRLPALSLDNPPLKQTTAKNQTICPGHLAASERQIQRQASIFVELKVCKPNKCVASMN